MRTRLPRPLLLALLLSLSATASAQDSTRTRVRDLNRQAMDAYQQLSMDEAEHLLEQALAICEQETCAPADAARTHVNLGLVAIGGSGDSARALQEFRRALMDDATVQIDPLLATPEITLLFQRAQAEFQQSGAGSTLGLRHDGPEEQLAHTPLPLYVSTDGSTPIARMAVRFRGNGMRSFRELPMTAMADGFGVEIPCAEVIEPALEYYIVVFAQNGTRLGTIGSEQGPFSVRIVRQRTLPAPALPGRMPPETCSHAECPPGVPDCHGATSTATGSRAGLGGSCSSDASCADGLVCEEGTCLERRVEEPGEWRRFWVEGGLSLTMASGHAGMIAASSPTVDPGGTSPQLDADPTNDSFVVAGENGCHAAPGEYCVRVTTPGRAWAYGISIGGGAWLTERIGLSLQARIAPSAGSGTLSHAFLSVRGHFRLLVPRPTGLHASIFVGAGVGEIQVRPLQTATSPGERIDRPWARTGLGGVELGGTVGYRITPGFGLVATPSFYALFPETSIGMQLSIGVDAAFGSVGGTPRPERRIEVPAGPADTDHDGLVDPSDACPTQAEDVDQYEDEDGCPEPDNDDDTVLDANDRCPNDAEDRDGFEDEDGCPDPDNDADSVLDASDRCPLEAGPASNEGCPEPDRDGDTVVDRVDNCPDEPGSPENHGCAARQLVVIEADRLEIMEKVYFRTNSHVIDRRSYALLDNIAAVLNAHPEIQHVSIEGHTDSRGDARRNLRLSQRRAASVMQYLTRNGHVAPTRLRSEGFGPNRPVYPNATSEEEHEANRRVEFRIEP